MNRAERRRREAAAKKYDARKSFSQSEVEDMNAHAFAIGTGIVLHAVQEMLGLGPVRMDRLRRKVIELESKYITADTLEPLPFDVKEVNQYTGKDVKE